MTIEELIQERSWSAGKGISGLDSADNYSGEDKSDYVIAFTQTRDSDILEQSNFSVCLDKLGGESDTVEIARFGHWACGWVEQILINTEDKKALSTLASLLTDFSDYPVLDDDDYFERQHEKYSEWAHQSKDSLALVLCRLFGLSEELAQDKDMLQLCYSLQMKEQHYGGEDASLFNNEFHVERMNENDFKDFERLLTDSEIRFREKENPMYTLICACFGIEEGERS